jgi:hypothetical protein
MGNSIMKQNESIYTSTISQLLEKHMASVFHKKIERGLEKQLSNFSK